jgi:hypothetical protein
MARGNLENFGERERGGDQLIHGADLPRAGSDESIPSKNSATVVARSLNLDVIGHIEEIDHVVTQAAATPRNLPAPLRL